MVDVVPNGGLSLSLDPSTLVDSNRAVGSIAVARVLFVACACVCAVWPGGAGLRVSRWLSLGYIPILDSWGPGLAVAGGLRPFCLERQLKVYAKPHE